MADVDHRTVVDELPGVPIVVVQDRAVILNVSVVQDEEGDEANETGKEPAAQNRDQGEAFSGLL